MLQFLYDTRKNLHPLCLGRLIPFSGNNRTHLPAGMDEREAERICQQLADHGLINWIGHNAPADMGYYNELGALRINAFGVDVVEGNKESPIALVHIDQSSHMDQSQHVSVSGSHGVQIARDDSNQQQTIINAFEEIVSAIDKASVTEQEKKEARSLLLKVLESKAAASVLGAGAAYLVQKLGGT